jgi:hypothetical protein
MDKHSPDILPAVELPKPETVSEQANMQHESPAQNVSEKSASQAIETGVSSSNISAFSQPPLPVPPGSPSDTTQAAAVQLGSAATAQLMADDADLIEKEWVEKAKEIIERTKNDPHAQNEEMTKVKADYLKKRYNKDINLSQS